MTTATQAANGKLLNQAICQHVAEHGPCTSGELFAQFGERGGADTRAARSKRFASRLGNLTLWGRLENVNPPGAMGCYMLGDKPLPAATAKPQSAPEVTQADQATAEPIGPPSYAWVPKVAPPPAYDVMTAPVYRQGQSVPARRGADAFLLCPSRNGNRLDGYHGGYVAALASGHADSIHP